MVTRHTTAPAVILSAFIERYPRPLKKYDLEKRCNLARETVRSWVPRMERYGWVNSRTAGTSNAGKKMMEYTLTERGLFQAGCLNPPLRSRVKRLLGGKYGEIEEKGTSARRKRMSDHLERWLPTLREIIQTGTAQPGFYYCLELTADKNGRVQLGRRTKVGLLPIK